MTCTIIASWSFDAHPVISQCGFCAGADVTHPVGFTSSIPSVAAVVRSANLLDARLPLHWRFFSQSPAVFIQFRPKVTHVSLVPTCASIVGAAPFSPFGIGSGSQLFCCHGTRPCILAAGGQYGFQHGTLCFQNMAAGAPPRDPGGTALPVSDYFG